MSSPKKEKKSKKSKKMEVEEEDVALVEDQKKKIKSEKKQKKEKKKAKKEKKKKEEEQKEKKKRKREADSASSSSSSSSPEDEEEERRARKKSRKDKKARRRRNSSDDDDNDEDAAAAGEPMDADESDLKKKKTKKKKSKKEKKEKKKRSKAKAKETKRVRDAEVLEAGERALKEEQAEADEAAAAAGGTSSSSAAATATAPETKETATTGDQPKVWPAPPPGNVTLLLFYQYVRPSWSPSASRNAENFARESLSRHGCTGRLRCAREGFNGTLTGSAEGIRAFCEDLRGYEPEHFGSTDFKLVDGLRDNQRLKGLKVWHVEELVTYGFGHATATRGIAPLEAGGTHLPPEEWHAKAAEPDTVLIDVRNANENAIGRFQPLGDPSRVLDPNMRTSTEFPAWVDEALPKLQQAKQVLMYCTGGIRCERASALLVQKGLDASKVFQLEGGIHRYLEAFPTGGHWIGKNYTFDRRFAHGAVDAPPEAQVPVGRCSLCTAPWDRYQAHKKCALCRMEVLLCRECERNNKHKGQTLKCHLCGGPKPSYLPPDDKTLKFKSNKSKSYYGAATSEGDY